MLEDFQGDSWGSIPPLRMSSLLPHDLCHGRSTSLWPPTVSACCGSVYHRASGMQDDGPHFAWCHLTGLVTSLIILTSSWPSTEVAFLCLLHCTYCVNFTSLLTQRSSFSWVELYRTSISFSLVILYTVHWQKQKVVWGKKVLYKGHLCWCCFSFFWIPTVSIYIGLCFGKN